MTTTGIQTVTTATGDRDSLPLRGVRVLDLSRVLAGPWASQLLADLGADVIKVERPGVGDDTRAWGPPFHGGPGETPADADVAGYFIGANRGKKSVTVDLSDKRGQQIVRDLARESDVLLENFRVGTLDRFGLDYDSLRRINESLVFCSITGFGQTGPRAHEPAYDFVIQAMGGLMSVTGERDDLPGGGPQKVGIPIVDLATGLYGGLGILAALYRTAVSGRGEWISIAMLDVQMALLSNQAMNYLMTDTAPTRNGNRHPNIQPQNVYRCRDGYIALAVGNDGQFRSLVTTLGLADLADDDRFRTNGARVAHVEALECLLASEFEKEDRASLVARLTGAGVPCGPINSIREAFDDPQVIHRRRAVQVSHPAGDLTVVASPFDFLASPPVAPPGRPPLLGEHTDEVLHDLGYDETYLAELRTDGVI